MAENKAQVRVASIEVELGMSVQNKAGIVRSLESMYLMWRQQDLISTFIRLWRRKAGVKLNKLLMGSW